MVGSVVTAGGTHAPLLSVCTHAKTGHDNEENEGKRE